MRITINLLPPSRKEEIRIQQITGIVLKVGFSAVFALVVFLLFLSSCSFIINIQKDVLITETDQLKTVKIYGEVQKTHDVVNEYYQDAQQLDRGLSGQISHISILEELNALIPDDLFLQEISIADDVIVLNGFSSNRDLLINFRDKLESSDFFGSVEAPISNFTASENVNFIFTIDISK